MTIADRVVLKDAAALGRRMDRSLPSRAFHGATLDALYEGAALEHLDDATADRLRRFVTECMDCGCDDAPFCGHPERRFVERLLRLRRDGLSPSAIVGRIERDYHLTVDEGDLLDFLDDAVRAAEAVEGYADVLAADEVAEDARRLRGDLVAPDADG